MISAPTTTPSAKPLSKSALSKAREAFSALKRHLNEVPGWNLVDNKDLDLFFKPDATEEIAQRFLKTHEKVSYGKSQLI